MTRSAEIAKAREVDTRIAAAWSFYHEVNDQIVAQRRIVAEADKQLSYSHVAKSARLVASFEHQILKANEAIAALAPVAAERRAAAIKLDKDEYEGWTRFFLVKHIHNTTRCSSFRPTTRVGWLPGLSGQTEAEAVAEHGAILCTICFPSAPTEWTRGLDVAADVCPGSGQPYFTGQLTGREGAYYSPAGYCAECGQWTTLTARGSRKVRKHKHDDTVRRIVVK